jgi:hypothetical protein
VLVLAAAVLAGACLAALLVDRGASAGREIARDRLDAFSPAAWITIVFGLISVALVLARAASGENLFDRYLLPVLPAVLVLVLVQASRAAGPRPAWTAGAAALAAVAALAVVYLANLSSGQVARWHAGERLVAAGYPASDVDAGWEWVGLHHPGPVDSGDKAHSRWRGPRSYGSTFTRAGNCGIVANHPLQRPGVRLIGRESYRTTFGLREETVFLYRNEPSCAAGGTP